MQLEAIIDNMVAEALKTSAIEGEFLSRQDVRSSICNQFALNIRKVPVKDLKAKGVANLMLGVRKSFASPLSAKKLFAWHAMLLPKESYLNSITIGGWRTHKEPMQVVPGHVGNWTVHYEAPPSEIVPKEMAHLISWFNESAPSKGADIKLVPIRSAIAHLYFENIHPFDDGSGRIGRAIAEKVLSQNSGRPILLSLSRRIEADKEKCYLALECAQHSNEIIAWIRYFLEVVLDAQADVESQITFVAKKSKFFDTYKSQLNNRQLKVINRMLEEGVDGFEGGVSAKKYMSIKKISKATATRDLQNLHEIGALKQIGTGRSTRYALNIN